MCHRLHHLRLLFVEVSSSWQPPYSFCKFGGVDLLPMFNQGDLSYTQIYNWYVVCVVQLAINYVATYTSSGGSMVCQQHTGGSDSIGLAVYDASTLY